MRSRFWNRFFPTKGRSSKAWSRRNFSTAAARHDLLWLGAWSSVKTGGTPILAIKTLTLGEHTGLKFCYHKSNFLQSGAPAFYEQHKNWLSKLKFISGDWKENWTCCNLQNHRLPATCWTQSRVYCDNETSNAFWAGKAIQGCDRGSGTDFFRQKALWAEWKEENTSAASGGRAEIGYSYKK